MEIDLLQIIHDNLILMVFMIIGLGYLLGNIKIAGIKVGPTIGVLLIGLFFGNGGFEISPNVATFGFTIFIFAVGYQAGPSFFSVFFEDGFKYFILSCLIAGFSVGLTLLLSFLFSFETGLSAGLMAGALTSTPTLAGAQNAINEGLAKLPETVSAAKALENVSVGYAITYIFGTAGLIVFIKLLPKIFKIDLPAEARKISQIRGQGKRKKEEDLSMTLPIVRAYRVTSKDVAGKTLADIQKEKEHAGYLLKIRRGDKLLDPDPELKAEMDDVFSVIGLLKDFKEFEAILGVEVLDADLLNYHVSREEVIMTNSNMVGKTIKEVDFRKQYGCFVVGIRRASIDLPIEKTTVIRLGDRLILMGGQEHIKKLADDFGYIERDIEETDLLTFSLGIGAGLVLGMVMVKIGNVSIGLGSAGGLLMSGILIGFLRAKYPTFGGLPNAALLLLKDFGLLLFMTGVGVSAGGGIAQALFSIGPVIIICGIVVTLLPVLFGYFFGRYVLKLNSAILLGSITGAMTSTPALGITCDEAKSNVPALGYAGTYTFANVLLTFAGRWIMTL
jgi:putative transport protein